MPLETIYTRVLAHSGDIDSGKVTIESVLDDIYKVYFAKPKVPDSKFLDVCRKYDPNFAPISSKTEREARAALTERVREGFRAQTIHQYDNIDPRIQKQYGESILRHHRILFRGLTVEAQEQLAQMLASGDEKALGQYFAERVLSKKDELLSMLYMSDAELVDHFFQNKDLLDLVKEMQGYRDLGYTEEQQQSYQELFNHMSALENLAMRMDLVSSPYYANFPCERFEMDPDAAMSFYQDMIDVALNYGESVGNADSRLSDGVQVEGNDGVAGPTYEFASGFNALRGMTMSVLDQNLLNFVRTYGADKTRDCVWAYENGRVGPYTKVMEALDRHQMIFVDIPGEGTKALHGVGDGFANRKPVEATPEEVRQHMLHVAEKGVKRVDEANPFFLAKFTGSAQYNQMAAQHKAVKEMVKELKFPLGEAEYQAAKKAVEALQQSTDQYLGYKRGQKLQEDKGTGLLIGRSANERRRLAAAQDALKLAEMLDFLIQYQKDPADTSRYMQQQEAARQEALRRPRVEPVPVSKAEAYAEEELSKTTKEELQPKVEQYEKMPKCQPSDAGPAMNQLQNDLPGAVNQVIKFTGMTKKLGANTSAQIKESVARMLLFDYVLRERAANGEVGKEGPVKAGVVEKALNDQLISPSKLARSPEFDKAFGKFTPARAEAFLKGDESRTNAFDAVVLSVLSPVKANAMANQPAQPQAKTEMQAQQPEPLKAAAPGMNGPG
jgi:hypothetical protein